MKYGGHISGYEIMNNINIMKMQYFSKATFQHFYNLLLVRKVLNPRDQNVFYQIIFIHNDQKLSVIPECSFMSGKC